jgi:hypothetical protein
VDGSSEGRPFQTVLPKCVNVIEAPLSAKCPSMFAGSTAQIPSFSVLPSGQFCAGARGDSPLQHQPSTHSLPGVNASSRQELRTNVLHVAEEPHFIIATRLVACRKMFRGPSVPFGNDDLLGGIVMAVCHRFCSASSAHARPLNLNRSRLGACGCGPAPSASSRWAGKVGGLSRTRRSVKRLIVETVFASSNDPGPCDGLPPGGCPDTEVGIPTASEALRSRPLCPQAIGGPPSPRARSRRPHRFDAAAFAAGGRACSPRILGIGADSGRIHKPVPVMTETTVPQAFRSGSASDGPNIGPVRPLRRERRPAPA